LKNCIVYKESDYEANQGFSNRLKIKEMADGSFHLQNHHGTVVLYT